MAAIRVTPLLLIAASFALAPAAAPADDEPVARPDVRAGDRWSYRRMDYATKASRGEYDLRVTFSSERGIVAVATEKNRPEVDTTWTADWNAVVGPTGDIYSPDTSTFRFPLAVGATYPSAFDLRRMHARGFGMRFERTAKVLGWEDIEVPAGRFRALRVEIDGSWKRVDVRASGTARTTMWYVPAVKRWVKYQYEDRASAVSQGEELLRFVPAD